MVDAERAERVVPELTSLQAQSINTPIPQFEALYHIPAYLGHSAHTRLENLMDMPLATRDSEPNVGDSFTEQRAGQAMGDLLGREKEFRKNLPVIQNNIKRVAKKRGVPEEQLWADVVEIMSGSAIGEPMHRTLSHDLGGAYGARDYIARHAGGGVVLIKRGAIANWDFTKEEQLQSWLGFLPPAVLGNITDVVYGGSLRRFKGPTELWRSEVRPHLGVVEVNDKGEEVSSLTEAGAAELIHVPSLEHTLGVLGIGDHVTVRAVTAPNQPDGTPANGDDVMRAIAQKLGNDLKNKLIIEIGNAPAGYIALAGGLVLAKEFGIDPYNQFVAIAGNRVDMVSPTFFNGLSPEQKSKRQNAATALNSYNGWQQKIAEINRYLADLRMPKDQK